MIREFATERHDVPLDRPFTTSRDTTDRADLVSVSLSDGEHRGVGAAAPSTYYGETADTVAAVLPEYLDAVTGMDPHATHEIEATLRERVRRNPAARAAVSVACHDLAARRVGLPLHRYLGVGGDPPPTSFTLGISDPETARERAAAAVAAGRNLLKVKVGTGDDEATLAAVREAAPDATVRVDANGAWTPHEAVSRVEALAAYGVEFVEQPVPAGADLSFVRERSPVPVAADESCITAADVPAVADAADIVVVKLMKCGGVLAARRQVEAAHRHGLSVMLGCMVESRASVAGAAHLAPLCAYADLDGPLLLADGADPFRGVPYDENALDLGAVDAGAGAHRR
jgi:L-alanine-DL-glutamate epimerase-like enolase superfamily enzyme